MACVALTSLISTIEIEFLQPTRRIRLSLHHQLLIISILENLSCLQAFLQNKYSGDGDDDGDSDSDGDEAGDGDGDALRDLDIQIRDFALKAEDHIELQLSNILLSEKASHEILHQTLEEAAKNATELLESCVSEREMASVALTILIKNFEQHFPKVYLKEHFPKMYFTYNSFLENLYSLQGRLLRGNSNSGAAIKKVEIKIRIFTLKAEDGLEIQLSNFLLAKHTEHEKEASRELCQTLQEAAKSAKELLKIIKKEKEHEIERELTCNALTSLRKTIDKAGIKSNLLENLSSLQVFMQKESNGGGAAMKDLETKIKHFALKAKDDIKVQLNNFLPVKDTEYEEKVSQKLHQTMQEAAESAAELLNIINSSRRSNEEEVDDDVANETQPLKRAASKSANVDSDGSSHGFLKPEDRMIGRHHDCTVIKDQLFAYCFGTPKIISIVGMVGIGKTIVARNVYEDPSVASHFDVRAWVTIPQHYNKRQMLREILQSIKPEESNVIKKGSTPDELQMQVRECLRGRKYLIVLDNIMSTQAWTDIKNWIPAFGAGSCILLTTRHFNQYKHSSDYIHNMTLLDPNESWELFGNNLSIEEHLAPKFEKIRNHVVEKCDGLPWLIVEVARRLSKCNNIQKGWKKIEKELESLGILDRNSLSVGYNMLPSHLKVCFLYFGVFPKRNRILVTMLIRLWIAEGFVMKSLEHMALDDQAYEYLLELIDRSLLLIEDRSCNGKIKTCRMHSAMHSFCVVEAQKEGILCAVNTQQHLGLSLKAFANSCRWLSLYSHSFDYYVLFGTNIPRSIFFFHENPEIFVPPDMLRVLAFDTSISLQRVPVQLGGLVFLRYLSITQWFGELNDVLSNNPNLETLVVSGNGAPTVHLPSSIWKPPHLRHLELGNSYMVDPPSADKENLQTLSWVLRPLHCRKEVYSKFPNIKNLKILLKDDIEPSDIGGCCSNPIILDHFNYFEWLEKLSISVSIGCNAALPELARFPKRLKELKLSGTNIYEGDLNVIAKLPQLKVLKLENAFHGTVWNGISSKGFPELIFLLLEAKELKQWVVSWDQFQMLSHLVLRSCNCLEQIPKRFSWLKSIELKGCHSSLVASAKQLQRMRKSKNPKADLEIKILGPEYDDSQNTHTQVSM